MRPFPPGSGPPALGMGYLYHFGGDPVVALSICRPGQSAPIFPGSGPPAPGMGGATRRRVVMLPHFPAMLAGFAVLRISPVSPRAREALRFAPIKKLFKKFSSPAADPRRRRNKKFYAIPQAEKPPCISAQRFFLIRLGTLSRILPFSGSPAPSVAHHLSA